jgi:sigma-B regulation protein RsbU (phosphoserine phosphatase)
MGPGSTGNTRCCDHICGADTIEAREIQQSLIPSGGLKSNRFEVAFRFSPLAEVGGDFADFFTLPNGLIGLYVGDVVGKGLSAAMYASLVMGMMRGINKTGAEPADVLALLSRRIRVRPVTGRYCATLYALFDPASNELKLANAGLPYPILVSKAGVSQVKLGGIPCGMFPGTIYEQHVVRLFPGDVVLFATDGLHEMRNQSDEDFSWKQLPEIWSTCAQKSADESLDLLFDGVKHLSPHPEQKDDITAVALKVPVPAEKDVPGAAADVPYREVAEIAASLTAGPPGSRRFR